MMEAVSEKEQGRNEFVVSAVGRGSVGNDILNESSRPPPTLERKISKRREAQEERNVVLDLFKELIGKFNEGISFSKQDILELLRPKTIKSSPSNHQNLPKPSKNHDQRKLLPRKAKREHEKVVLKRYK